MEPEADRHQRLLEVFLLVTETIDAEREAALDAACAGDPELRREVDRLIAADRAAGNLLDRPVLAHRGPFAQVCPQCHTCFDAGPQQCSLDGATLQPAFEGATLIDGRYRIEKRLGSGGMGAVYRALHIGLDKRFALKLIRSGPMLSEELRERFRREGKALGRLQHPNIVGVTDAGVDPTGRPYLVMELLEGSTLQAILKREGVLPPDRAIPILRGVAAAIDYAHLNRVIHGDIKPGNILITADGRVKILDFGLAELLDAGRGKSSVMGTPAYMTAAVLDGAPNSEAADHHALAVLAYELLTGTVPYGAKPAEVRAAQKQPPPRPGAVNKELPRELDAPLVAGLQSQFSTALQLLAPLEAAWHKVRVQRWRNRELPVRSGLALVLALLLLLPAGWLARTASFRIVEARTRDLRFRLRPDRPPDPRIVLLSLDDATLAADSTPLIARAGQIGQQLERVFTGQPQSLGIDLILPVQWSASPEFQRLILQHAPALKLALLSTPQGDTSGVECISPMVSGVLGSQGVAKLFAFVNLEEDPDGAVRRGRYSYRDRNGAERPLLAAAVTGRTEKGDAPFWLDQAIRWQDLARISWKDLDRVDPAQFRGRYVFAGAEFAGSGDENHRVPPRPGRPPYISGLALHGLMAATILEGSPVRDVPWGWVLLRRALLLALPLGLFLCAPRTILGVSAAAGLAVLSMAIDLLVFRFSGLFFSMAAEYVTLCAGILLAVLVRSNRPAFPLRS